MMFDINKGAGFYRGRVALAAILNAFGLRPGDAVAVQAFTCSALSEALLYCGLEPQWIDIDPETFTMSPGDLEAKLTPATRAVIIQHTYGIPADIDAIAALCDRHGLFLIEDCCHTMSSTWRGQIVGTLGDAAFYSFEAGKPLVIGLGGWGVINNSDHADRFAELVRDLREPALAQQAKILAMYAAFRVSYAPNRYWKIRRFYRALRDMGLVASNYNANDADGPMFNADEFGWSLGRLQRSVLAGLAPSSGKHDAARRQIAAWYREAFSDRLSLPNWQSEHADPVLIRFPVEVPDKKHTLAVLEAASIEASDNYSTPVHPYTGAMLERAGYPIGSCPNAEKAGQRVVALSCAPTQSKEAVEITVDTIVRSIS